MTQQLCAKHATNTSHVHARKNKPDSYPERFAVPDTLVAFEIAMPQYIPTEFSTTGRNQLEADIPDFSPAMLMEMQRAGAFNSFERPVSLDGITKRPLNVRGRTGMTGLGTLYRFGPNNAADAIVIRENATATGREVLLIKRRDGAWALPGGFYLPQKENSLDASLRELKEETSVHPTFIERLRCQPKKVYEGYADDYRNTDNAWIETSAWLFQLDRTSSVEMKLCAGDDASDARWFAIEQALTMPLFSAHNTYLKNAVAEIDGTRLSEALKIRHYPYLTAFKDLVASGARRIALFGGSFDPVHEGHVESSQIALKELDLDAVVFIPAKRNPLKPQPTIASSVERVQMLGEVLQSYPGCYVSDVEITADENPSYTVDTLKKISDEIAETGEKVKLYLLLGSDIIEMLHSWRKFHDIQQLATLVFQPRGYLPPERIDILKKQLAVLCPTNAPCMLSRNTIATSSTDIRKGLATGERLPVGMLPAVAKYLEGEAIYRMSKYE